MGRSIKPNILKELISDNVLFIWFQLKMTLVEDEKTQNNNLLELTTLLANIFVSALNDLVAIAVGVFFFLVFHCVLNHACRACRYLDVYSNILALAHTHNLFALVQITPCIVIVPHLI